MPGKPEGKPKTRAAAKTSNCKLQRMDQKHSIKTPKLFTTLRKNTLYHPIGSQAVLFLHPKHRNFLNPMAAPPPPPGPPGPPPPPGPLPPPFVQMAAAINAAYGGQLATVADIQNALAPINAQLLALNAQMLALPAQINASVLAALAPHNAAAIAATASATVLAIATARARNAHDRDGEDYAVVPRTDGTPPPNWPPAGMDRGALAASTAATVNALLGDYQLAAPPGTALRVRRNMLARHIGTPCL